MEKKIIQAFLLLLISSITFAQDLEFPFRKSDSTTNGLNSPFTAFSLQTRDSKKVVLQWALQPGLRSEYFSIERNVDGKNYETIGVIRSISSANKYEFTDEIPTRGNSLYRVRVTLKARGVYSSDSIAVNIPGSALITFYPNPVDNVLIIRSAFTAEVLIADGMGKARILRNVGVGPSIIDVSALEKGVYLLRITDKITNQQQIEKIMKN